MNTEQRFETKRIDHLGIVAGTCHEIDLIEQIDQAAGSSERKVSCGQAVTAMVLNALGFSSRAMYLMPQYLHNKPVDLLIAPELTADDFNDDTLGRSLDQLYEAGITEVFAKVAAHALEVHGIEHQFYHLDSSSFHVHGEYAAEESNSHVIEITHGYSKDHRPDLKQVVVSIITGQLSRLPVWVEALSGNSSDKKSFPKTVQAFCKQMKAGQNVYFVVDSALYTADNLKMLAEIGWLTRVPKTLAEAKRLLAETDVDSMIELEDGYAYDELSNDYGGVSQRWLVVYSPEAAKREEKTLTKRVEKERKAAQKAWRKLSGQRFRCKEDALSARDSFQERWKYHRVKATPQPIARYPGPGRPPKGATPDVVGYQLQGEVIVSEEAIKKARHSLGKFILASNELNNDKLPSEAMLSQYKAQGVSVERGFRFLKDPLFFADSLFLKNPERIMALIMVMVLALLVYALAERKLRLRLEQEDQSVPDQVGKETKTPTMRWIFQLFEGIDLLIIYQDGDVIDRQVLNLRPEHLTVIRLLGPPVEYCYLIDS
jgi:transposase